MKLKKLTIEASDPYWDKHHNRAPGYTGKISFSGETGDITCNLDKSLASKFLMFASDVVLDTARKAQDSLITEIEKSVAEAVSNCVALEFKGNSAKEEKGEIESKLGVKNELD